MSKNRHILLGGTPGASLVSCRDHLIRPGKQGHHRTSKAHWGERASRERGQYGPGEEGALLPDMLEKDEVPVSLVNKQKERRGEGPKPIIPDLEGSEDNQILAGRSGLIRGNTEKESSGKAA